MSLLGRWQSAISRRGLIGALRAGVRESLDGVRSSYPYARILYAQRHFHLDGRPYRYFVHTDNRTWRNERAVEVPIAWEAVNQFAGRRILEVGNVLSRYFPVSHDRVDKYEKAGGVVNEDIVSYDAPPYDLIVSISTLEHVGWDEEPREPEKVLRAFANLLRLAAPGGRVIVTLPMAYNPHLDAFLRDGRFPFTRRLCLRCVTRDNRWEQVPWQEVEGARHDFPFRRTNALIVGITDIDAAGHPIR